MKRIRTRPISKPFLYKDKIVVPYQFSGGGCACTSCDMLEKWVCIRDVKETGYCSPLCRTDGIQVIFKYISI